MRSVPSAPIHELGPNEGDPAALLASPPVVAPLAAFDAGANAALVVCGPQRVRMLVGTAGTPGLVPLLLARCAASLADSGGASGIYGLSVFFAMPEGDDVADGSVPRLHAVDALDGMETRHGWERCAMETFTDIHKVYGTLVRILSGSAGREGTSSQTATSDLPRRHNRYLGRLPLVFRISLLNSGGQAASSITCRSLLLVDAPSAVAAGPVPSAYSRTAELLKLISCCVLHAASGDAPTDMAPIRAALGPLQLLLDESSGSSALPASALQSSHNLLLPVPFDIIVEQADRAARDLAGLLSTREKSRQAAGLAAGGGGSGFGSAGPGAGTAGIPPADLAAAWRASFGLREITTAEVQRQLPLACDRALRLHRLLEVMGSFPYEEKGKLEQLLQCVDPLTLMARNIKVEKLGAPTVAWTPNYTTLEITTMAWQRQWQAQQLMGRLNSEEELDRLRAKVTYLTQLLEEARSANTAAQSRQRACAQAHSADLKASQEELVAVREALEAKCQEAEREAQECAAENEARLTGQLNAERAQLAEVYCELELQRVQELSLERRMRVSHEMTERLQAELVREEGRTSLLTEELHDSQQRIRKWRNDNHTGAHSVVRTRELEGSKQRLTRDLREARGALERANSEKDRAVSLLRQENANCAAAQRRADSLGEELARLQVEFQLQPSAAGEFYHVSENKRSASIEAALSLAQQFQEGGARSRYPSCPPRLSASSSAALVSNSTGSSSTAFRKPQAAGARPEAQSPGSGIAQLQQRPSSAGSSGSRPKPAGAGSLDGSRAAASRWGSRQGSRTRQTGTPRRPPANSRVAQLLSSAAAAIGQSGRTPPRTPPHPADSNAQEAIEIGGSRAAHGSSVTEECTGIEDLQCSRQWPCATALPEGDPSVGLSKSVHIDEAT